MLSTEVAELIVSRHGQEQPITNLSLNKLVYLAQVESLQRRGQKPLFSDEIEAWQYGPVEPAVYHLFKHFGRAAVSISYEQEVRSKQFL